MMKLSVQNIKNSNQLKNVSDAVSNQNTGGFVDGNTNPALDDYEYDDNDFQVKGFEKVFCEESERSSEWQDELGLNFYDYGARNYDPAAPRFWHVDPLAEEYSNLSIYNYVNNNPI